MFDGSYISYSTMYQAYPPPEMHRMDCFFDGCETNYSIVIVRQDKNERRGSQPSCRRRESPEG